MSKWDGVKQIGDGNILPPPLPLLTDIERMLLRYGSKESREQFGALCKALSVAREALTEVGLPYAPPSVAVRGHDRTKSPARIGAAAIEAIDALVDFGREP